MKKASYPIKVMLVSLVVLPFLFSGCSDGKIELDELIIPEEPTEVSDKILVENFYTFNESDSRDCGGMAYHKESNSIFYILNGSTDTYNEIRRLNLETMNDKMVYQYEGGVDKSLRLYNEKLYVARTFHSSILQLSDLDKDQLSLDKEYYVGNPNSNPRISPLLGVCDVAVRNDELLFVCGDHINFFFNSVEVTNHLGVQSIKLGVEEVIVEEIIGLTDVSNEHFSMDLSSVEEGNKSMVLSKDGAILMSNNETVFIFDKRPNYFIATSLDYEFGIGLDKTMHLEMDSKGRHYTLINTDENPYIKRGFLGGDNDEYFYLKSRIPTSNGGNTFVVVENGTDIDLYFTAKRVTGFKLYKATIK